MTATLARLPELTAAERCDRCGAAAKLRVVFPSAAQLLLCGHHGRKHQERLRELDADLRWGPEPTRRPTPTTS